MCRPPKNCTARYSRENKQYICLDNDKTIHFEMIEKEFPDISTKEEERKIISNETQSKNKSTHPKTSEVDSSNYGGNIKDITGSDNIMNKDTLTKSKDTDGMTVKDLQTASSKAKFKEVQQERDVVSKKTNIENETNGLENTVIDTFEENTEGFGVIEEVIKDVPKYHVTKPGEQNELSLSEYYLKDGTITPNIVNFPKENKSCAYWNVKVSLDSHKSIESDAIYDEDIQDTTKFSTDENDEERYNSSGNIDLKSEINPILNTNFVCFCQGPNEACTYRYGYKDSLNHNEGHYAMTGENVRENSRDSAARKGDQIHVFTERNHLNYTDDYEYHCSDEEHVESPSNKRMKKDAKMARHFVHHDYHDHSSDQQIEFCSTFKNLKNKPNRGGVSVPFPLKLHRMLEQAGKENLKEIVGWQPHGRCFIVHKPKEFVELVMPKYFRQTKLTSFQRQLNLYGFCRLTRGKDSGGYYHELFLRGRSFLCQFMTRTKIKGTGTKAASSPESEPDFYSMPFVDNLAEQNYNDQLASDIKDEKSTPKKKEHIPTCNEEKSALESIPSSNLPVNKKETKIIQKMTKEASRELLWNRPFYYMESLSLTKNRLKRNERKDTDTKDSDKVNPDLLIDDKKPLANPQEDQDSSWDLLWHDSSPSPFDLLHENDYYDSLRLDDDLSLGCILDKIVS